MMDAFKLLTRSTKLKPSNASTPTASTRLPSTGKAENPQLFRNPTISDQSSHGTKRKRGGFSAEEEEEVDDASVDFFGSGNNATNSTTQKSQEKSSSTRNKDHLESEDGSGDEMDDVQCRTILNSHKIKVTDLRDFDGIHPVQTEEPKRKKKRKNQEDQKQKQKQLSKKELKKARRIFPRPLGSFKELRSRYHISRRLAENVAEQGFTVPTEVQLGSLPLLLGETTGEDKKPDLLVVAPTGSGKTLAFLIPVVNNIVRHHHERQEERGVLSVIIAPTKELAGQIVNEGRKLVLGTGVKITMMKKGMRVVDGQDDANLDEESAESSKSDDEKKNTSQAPVTKSDILVTTPLLLVNALSANRTKTMATLPLVRNLVLDEADVLLDPLFREQTLDIWRSCTHPDLRTSLWSATMGSNIEELTKSTIKERSESSGTTTKSNPLLRLVVGLKDSAIPTIDHKLIYAGTEQGKLLGLRQLLHPTAAQSSSDVRLRPPFLIFTQTIPRAVALHSELRYDIPPEAGGSSRIAVLHSDLSDTQRSEIMKGFRKGEIWILVTTDLLARGVDFRGINGVVNYDIPTSAAIYVHRVGRTGRAGREGGLAVTYYTKEDIPYVKSIANIINVSESAQAKNSGSGSGSGSRQGEKSIQRWLLDSLPDLKKRDKKELKKHGVKARQSSAVAAATAKDGRDGREQRRTRISTKSGYERQMENRKRGAIEASKARKAMEEEDGSGEESWDGLDG